MSNPTTKSPEDIEHRLVDLGVLAATAPVTQLAHADQTRILEWQGADVRITSDFTWEPKDFMDGHDLLVRTRHAKSLTWLLFELRDAFSGHLDAWNKYVFYGSLAKAALDHLAIHQPEDEDPRPLLKAVLSCAFSALETLRRDGELPSGPMIVIHESDAEGRQKRRDADTNQDCV